MYRLVEFVSNLVLGSVALCLLLVAELLLLALPSRRLKIAYP